MIEKAPINLIVDREYTVDMLAEMEEQRNADHQYYLTEFAKWLRPYAEEREHAEVVDFWGIPLKDYQALLKEAGGE